MHNAAPGVPCAASCTVRDGSKPQALPSVGGCSVSDVSSVVCVSKKGIGAVLESPGSPDSMGI